MGYYIRVLGLNDLHVGISDLRARIPAGQELIIETGPEDSWSQLILRHKNGSDIALIEKNPVVLGELGYDELQEFIENIEGEKPESAVEWLRNYLPLVKVIYAFQLLSGTDEKDGWDGVHAIQRRVWNICGGILQSDGEGFSNEDGFHILWQFSDNANGPRQMAVILPTGRWQAFEIQLANADQRATFFEGKVPAGAKLISSS